MKRFKDGREATEEGSLARRSVTATYKETVGDIQEYIPRDGRVTMEHVAYKFVISYYTAQGIMTDRLGMCIVFSKMGAMSDVGADEG
jgi:hypothetical protein